LLEGEAIEPPFLIVVIMHDGGIRNQEHVVIPVNQVRSIVVSFLKESAQFLVSQFLHLKRDLHCIAQCLLDHDWMISLSSSLSSNLSSFKLTNLLSGVAITFSEWMKLSRSSLRLCRYLALRSLCGGGVT
jgi:hypothetical protein